MLTFECSDVGNGREDVAGVGGGPFYAVPVIDPSLSSFSIDIEILEVIVEID